MLRILDSTLKTVLPPAGRIALVGAPAHSNVGDHLIWLGTVKWLKQNGYTIDYASDMWFHSADDLRRSIDRGVTAVLITGGGNLGDLHLPEQRLRAGVLSAVADVPIIQLPQSIYFSNPMQELLWLKVATGHPDFRLMVRDSESAERAAASGLSATLCPDMAFALGPVRSAQPTEDVVWLMRPINDPEVARTSEVGGSVDWFDESLGGDKRVSRSLWMARRAEISRPLLNRALNHRARTHLRRGVALCSPGRTIITDRLHGFILAMMMGRRCILLDNSYGKCSAFFETWSANLTEAYLADSPEHAFQLALRRM